MGRPTLTRRAVATLRDEGLRGLLFRALGRVAYRRLLVFARELDRPLVERAAGVAIVTGLLDGARVDEYARFRPDASVAETRARLREGQWCFVARHDGVLVHATWAVAGRAPVGALGREFPLAPDDVFVFDACTDPDFRSRGIATATYAAIARFLRDAGFQRTMCFVPPENRPVLRWLAKIGARPVGVMGRLHFGPLHRDFQRSFSEKEREQHRGLLTDN